MRRLVVSDIHGEGKRLLEVLDKAGYEPGVDRLFLLGDYIDRGSDSKYTVDMVRSLVKDGAVALKGNHEAMMWDALTKKSSTWMFNGGEDTAFDFRGSNLEEAAEWLNNLPLYHEEPDCILVHAGIFPGLPLEEQNPNNFLWIREVFYNNYHGPKKVIFGHTPTPYLYQGAVPKQEQYKPWRGSHMLGIDTGAVYGGPLTLVDIDSEDTWTA